MDVGCFGCADWVADGVDDGTQRFYIEILKQFRLVIRYVSVLKLERHGGGRKDNNDEVWLHIRASLIRSSQPYYKLPFLFVHFLDPRNAFNKQQFDNMELSSIHVDSMKSSLSTQAAKHIKRVLYGTLAKQEPTKQIQVADQSPSLYWSCV